MTEIVESRLFADIIHVICSDGRVLDKNVEIAMAHIVNGLLLRDGKILMTHRSPERPTYPNTWSFPGGHVQAGETLQRALARELNEEIGIIPVVWNFLTTLHDNKVPSGEPITFHLFVVSRWHGEPAMQGDEHSELSWIALQDARGLQRLALAGYDGVFQTLITP